MPLRPIREIQPPTTGGSLKSALPWIALGVVGVVSLRSADLGPPAVFAGTPPVGTIMAFAGPVSSIPQGTGWVLCDGRELSAAEFPELYAALGSAWGRGRDSGSFRIPDLRGRFLRGVNYDAPGDLRDPDRDHRGISGPGGNAGNEVGSLQEDAAGPHVHAISGVADAIGQGQGAEWIRFHANKVPDETAPILSNTGLIQPPGAAETRPRNVYVNWIVRCR